MSDQERLRRPALDRTGPIRSWTTVAGFGASLGDTPLEQGVRNANRVVEEYLRAGEASARTFQRTSTNNRPDDIAQRMVRAASDFATFWLELLTRTAAVTDPTMREATSAASSPETTPSEATGVTSIRVCVEVDAARPVTIALDVNAQAGERRLCVDRLHARTGKANPLTGVEIDTRSGEPMRVRLRPRATQPAGTYDGVVLDESTSLPVGTLSVTLHSARRPTRPTRRS